MKSVRSDELEVSVFGPGYGESIVVHLGSDEWIIVDSCRDPITGTNVPLEYLRRLGVDPAISVRLVVATHWHDDHVRGLSEIVEKCTAAQFVCSPAMTRTEFVTMVTRYEEAGSSTPVGSGVREMHLLLRHLSKTGRQIMFASPNRLMLRSAEAAKIAGGPCEVTTLSPADKQLEMFLRDVAQQMPQVQGTIHRAVPPSPNHIAVALWIAAGGYAVLLGSDLQETVDEHRGWTVIVESEERPVGQASVFKIPHHGSANAHSDTVWDRMIEKGAYAVLTPFSKGDVILPTRQDVDRIREKAGIVYITSDTARATATHSGIVMRGARGHRLKFAQPEIGHVRFRRRYGMGHRWYANLGGRAHRLG